MIPRIPRALLLAATLACSPSRIDPSAELPTARRVLRVPQQYSTIQAAVAAAGVGDRIVVGPGIYEGTVVIAGAARNNLQILAESGEREVILQGDHTQQTAGTCKFRLEPLCPERAGFFLRDVEGVIIRGFTVRDFGVGAMSGIGEGFLLVNAHRNRIEQNVVTRTDMMGVTLFNSSQNLVERNTFYGNDPDEPMRVGTGCGVHIQTSEELSRGVAEQNIIQENLMYGNPFSAVMLRGAGPGNQIVDNELRGGGAWGVTNRTTDGTRIENNRITNHTGFKLTGKPLPVDVGVGIDIAGSSQVVIRNNLLQNNSTFDIEWDGTGQNSFQSNGCTKASPGVPCDRHTKHGTSSFLHRTSD
jgi:parallel beta-helix repeat protein